MKRVITIPDTLQDNKYYFKEEYAGFGIYQRRCPSGYYVSQDYLITNGNITIVSQSYNNLNIEDLMDAIDEYNETGKFNLKAINRGSHYILHSIGGKPI